MFRPILATSLILLGASAGTAQLPSIIGMGADNAAGVLGYCVKNRLVDATSANAVLDKLHKKPGVRARTPSSPAKPASSTPARRTFRSTA